ncbi:MAG TPA: hypothetical protein VHP11_06265 [Tepidisphaeraceae bacterium]|nr:hypothetical protein [Tepidisphaeraceae bacterium]
MANPTARVASHHHIPTFIVHALDQGKPGIFLIRKPEDSVVSWAIYWKGHLKACLDYYIDYHHTLLPYIPKLFIAPFEVTTTRFDRVIDGFNQAFGTNYAAFKHDPAAVSDCFSRIEKVSPMDADGSVNEFAVCRPSPRRNELKPKMLQELRSSPLLLRKLGDANALYAAFCHAPSPLALPDTPPRRHQVLQTVS